MMSNIPVIWGNLKHKIKRSKKLSLAILKFQVYSTKRSLRRSPGKGTDLSSTSYRCHLVVLNSIEYVYLAQICVLTFLHFHPNAKFFIHTDRKVVDQLRKIFRVQLKHDCIKIQTIEDNSFEWQRRKLEVILAMNDVSDIFMDADLRWNGKLPELQGTTVYFREFSLLDYENYISLIPRLKQMTQACMYNSSFISFKGNFFSDKQKLEILSLQEELSCLKSSEITESDLAAVRRMSEQIALSILLDSSDRIVFPLKIEDSRSDGSFVESCYFGVTGLAF